MTISTEYRVTVDVPLDVWENFKNSQEYEQLTIDAEKGNLEAGTDFYSDPFHWAIFDSMLAAKRCEAKLESVMIHFKNKLNEKQQT